MRSAADFRGGRTSDSNQPEAEAARFRLLVGIDGSTHFDEVLDEHNTSGDVYADRGYPSAQRSQMLKALGYREHVQRKARASQALSECQKGRNKRIAKTRVRVEHPFAQMRHMGGKLIRTIGQTRATVAMTMMATCYNFQRLAKSLDDGEDAFYKACPIKERGAPARGQWVKNASNGADSLNKKADLQASSGLRRDACRKQGFLEVPLRVQRTHLLVSKPVK